MRRGSRLSRRRRRGEEERRGDEERRGEEERRRGEEEQATDIKSNNPHLAGGEKHAVHCFRVFKSSFWCPKWSLLVDEQTVNEKLSQATTTSAISSRGSA